MNKAAVTLIVLLFLTTSCSTAVLFAAAEPKTIVVPDDYPSIQTAVGNASPGDIVFVRKGNYAGGIALNKPMTLKGEDAKSTIIVGGATLENLTPILASAQSASKMSLLTADKTTQILDLQTAILKTQPINWIPPPTYGVYINSSDVAISGFTIMGGTNAINGNGDRLHICENIIGACNLGGSNITVANNTRIGLSIGGFHNLIANNVGSLTLVSSNSTVFGNSLGSFNLENAHSNIIVNNTLTGANMGLWIGSSITSSPRKCSYNLFAGNTIENCGLWGILLGDGAYNVFYGNIVRNTGAGIDHDGYGLALGGTHLTADNNLFLRNIFVNNSKNFGANWAVEGTNYFDDGKEGNYWDDYLKRYPSASQVGNTGTGNTPYTLLGMGMNVDNHPLLNQPDISDKIPLFPEPWASLLPSTENLSIPEFPSSVVLLLLITSISFATLICFKKNKQRKGDL